MLRLKRIWNRLDLRLTALVLLLTVLPLLALETFALNSSQRTLEQQQFDHLNAVTVLKSDEINRWVRNGVQRLNNLAQRPLLREYADALTRPDTPAADAQQARDNLLNNHLLPIRTEDGGFWRLFLLDAADGRVLVSTDSSTVGESRSTESYFIEGQKGAYVQNVYFASALGEPAMSIGTPVRNSAGEVVAVLAGHLDLTELADIVGQSVDLTHTEDAYLVNAAHFFITDPRFVGNVALRETIHTDGVNRCLQGQSGHGVYTDYRGTAVFGAYRWLPERELCVLTEIDEAEALASINALRQSWLLVGALVLAGVATSGLFFTRSITTPLRQLTQGAERVGQGDLQHQIPVRGQDEIGQLTTSFNRMTHSLRHAQAAAAAALASQTAIARQNARLVEQTRESEARYRAIVEHAAIGIARVDMAGRPVQVNPAMQAMLGYSEAELSQMVFTEFTHPEDAANDMALYQELIAGQRDAYYIEKRYIAKDGRLVWVQLIASLVRDADGEPQFAIGLVHDITTQKESQQELQRYRDRLEELVAARTAALRHSEARFRALFEAVPIPVLVTRFADGAILQANDHVTAVTGIPAAQLIGYDMTQLYQDQDERPAHVARVLAHGYVHDDEVVINRPDGETRTLLLSSALIQYEGEQALLTAFQDVTAQKQAQAQLEAYAAELGRSNRELEQFAYVASHDLQEPLRMVTSYLQLLQRRYRGQLDANADEFIAYAVDGAERMKVLINDLLAYSRVGTRGKPLAPADAKALLQRALDNLQLSIAETGARVHHDPLPTILADDGQFVQLLQNLIGNAIKFRGAAPPEVHVGVTRQDAQWRFAVSDNGIGFEPQFAERIFVIFQRLHTRSEYGGTGIGLAICKKIVERHGGQIWAESTPDVGTTIYFTLPAAEPEAAMKGSAIP